MAGKAAICPFCYTIMSTNVTNTTPISRKCSKCKNNIQWWLDKKTGEVQVGRR